MIIKAAQRLSGVTTYYFARKLAEIDEMNNDNGPSVLNLGIGSPDLLPPQSVQDKLKEGLNQIDAHKYQSYKGIPHLRNAFSRWYKNHFNIDIDSATQVLPLIGSKEGVMHISMAFLDPGDEVLVPNPGYPSYSMCTKLAGGTPVDMPLIESKGWKPDFEALRKMDLSRVKLMWLNYPNMPTGAQADEAFFAELVEFAIEKKILICHDNPYTFILTDNPVSIFNTPGAEECAVELVSLSKCYNMAGWRIGAVIGAKSYIDNIMTFKSNMDSGMFKPIQEAASLALSLGKDWIDDLNAQYFVRKEVACQLFDELDLEYSKEGAGLFVWGKIKDTSIDSEELSNSLLHEARVFITPGHIFGSQGNQYLRISLCSSEEDMKAGLERIQHNRKKTQLSNNLNMIVE